MTIGTCATHKFNNSIAVLLLGLQEACITAYVADYECYCYELRCRHNYRCAACPWQQQLGMDRRCAYLTTDLGECYTK